MERELRPTKWPHFMEKKHLHEKKTYKSKKILGLLYDQVQLIDFKPAWENTFDNRILEAFNLDEDILIKAAEIKSSYDESLKRLMAKHGVGTEFEAWSVFVLYHNHESNDYKFAEEFGRTIDGIKCHFRETCRKAAGVDASPDWSRLGPFVAAMYTVTARESVKAMKTFQAQKVCDGPKMSSQQFKTEHMPFISFPWLFPSELGRIATGASAPHRAAPMQAYHGLPFRNKNESKPVIDLKPMTYVTMGEGITHYGELLNMDVSPAASESKSPHFHEVEATEGELVLKDSQNEPFNQEIDTLRASLTP